MNYKITITNDGNHISNPLLKLRGNTYATREEACEAIYAALYDVIYGDNGCEMVKHPRFLMQDFVVCDDDSWSNWAMLYRRDSVETQREYATKTGFDNPNEIPDDELPTIDLYDYLVATGGRTNNLLADDDISELVTSFNEYADKCHEFIMREGYASEDGVSATVEEVAE